MLLDFDKLGSLRPFLIGLTVLVCLFLILPIVFIAALSFGSSQWLIFPPPSWTFKWYQDLFADPRWLWSALTSLKIAAIVTVLSVVIGFLAALGLNRGTFVGRDVLRALFLTPMILPVVVLAVALYALFLRLGLAGTTIAFVIAHLLIALPFSIISIGNALDGFDRSLSMLKALHERGVGDAFLAPMSASLAPSMASEVERTFNRFDRDGILVATSGREPPARISIGDRAYFRQARDEGGPALRIGVPTLGRVSQVTVIPLVKRLETVS